MQYNLVRSTRKTIAIHITKNGEIEVRAPHKTKIDLIEQFLNEKQHWCETQQLKTQQQMKNRQSFTKTIGDEIVFLGQNIIIKPTEKNKSFFDEKTLYVNQNAQSKTILQQCIKFYKEQADIILKEKVHYFSKIMHVYPQSVKINSAAARWGSCSTKGSINFSWKLIMAAEPEIDYVVVHELAHLKQHNHSAAFWMEVEKILPHYKQCEAELKSLHKKIANESW